METATIISPSGQTPLHTSNKPLSESQKSKIEALISGLEEENRLIDTKMDNLELERGSKKAEIAMLKGMISPLKNFPNELIAKVFEEYASKSFQTPWLLGHISSKWREIALTTPNLWRDIQIYLCDSYTSFDKETELLGRGERGFIALRVVLGQPPASLDHFIPVFTQYAHCLRYLALHSIDTALPLLYLPGGLLSSLEALSLCCFPDHYSIIPHILHTGEPPHSHNITLFVDTPCLRRVTIEAIPHPSRLDLNILPLRLPWTQLTHLHISPWIRHSSWNGLLSDTLRQCSSLVSCRLPIPVDGSQRRSSSIELKHLEAFEIMNGFIEDLDDGQLLRQLVLPSLKRLILTSPLGKPVVNWPQRDIVDLILRSACNIEVLHGRAELEENFTIALLEIMPLLKEVHMIGTSFLLSIFGRMAYQEFLPNVTSIECRTRRIPADMDDELWLLIEDTEFIEPFSGRRQLLSILLMGQLRLYPAPQLEELQRKFLEVKFQRCPSKLILLDREFEL